MSDQKERKIRLLDEVVVKNEHASDSADENAYWLEDENESPVPTEEQGCVRRGACCRTNPGWFGPGEVEAAAEFLGLDPGKFAKTYLVIDSIEHPDHDRVEVFAPLKLDRNGNPSLKPLSRADDLYRFLKGQCIFYKDGGCRIYAARPVECRVYFCGHDPEKNLSHQEIAEMWVSGELKSPKLSD